MRPWAEAVRRMSCLSTVGAFFIAQPIFLWYNKNMRNLGFKNGIADSVPVGLSYLSVSFAFGIFAVSSGLLPLEAFIISVTNLTSAGQLAGVPIFITGTAVEMIITQFVINLRYSLMAVALSQKTSAKTTIIERLIMAFGITDEIFAIAVNKPTEINARYFYGLMTLPIVCWSGGTLLGAFLGSILPARITSALGIMIYAMFLGIIIPPAIKHKPIFLCIIISVALSCAFKFLPGLNNVPTGFVMIICAVIAAAICAYFFPVNNSKEETA